MAATNTAIDIASLFEAEIHVVHVADLPELPPGIAEEFEGELVATSNRIVEQGSDLSADAGVPTQRAVLASGDPIHEVLIHYATEHDIDGIVMGTTGRTGLRRVALGSVAERTIRTAPIPVITVRPDSTPDTVFDSILVPTDGSSGATAALNHGLDLAKKTTAEIHLLHVVTVGAMGIEDGAALVYDALEEVGKQAIERAREQAIDADVGTVEASIVSGQIHRAITRYATEHGIDTIVMGTHGRSGLNRLWIGSVTQRVIRHSPVPVVSVKPPAALEELSGFDPSYAKLAE